MASTSSIYYKVELSENDVPGAKLAYSLVENHSIVQLKRWLQCRDLKTSGKKDELVKRVTNCIESGGDRLISLSVDGGKWYDLKLQELQQQKRDSVCIPKPNLMPITGWNVFPSVNLPKHFNHGHIHHHIVESVQFIDSNKEMFSDDDDDDDIDDLHTAKPLKKGKDFFKSGHVQAMKDCEKGGKYFLKAKVMASYNVGVFYDTTVQISKESGFVKDASCSCVASAMGRCSHVCALLFALDDYIANYGTDITSCTSRKCEWNKGRTKEKNPKRVADTNYQSVKKRRVDDIESFDPTPGYKSRSTKETVSDLLFVMEQDKACSMWQSLLYRHYDEYHIDSQDDGIMKKRDYLIAGIAIPNSSYPQEIVSEQGSHDWFLNRRIRVTASNSRLISMAQNAQTVYSILEKKLWKDEEGTKQTKAQLYGCMNESKAFETYRIQREKIPGFQVIKTGLWCNSKHPEIACSPDGLVVDPKEENKYGILEIKCPMMLKNKDILEFDKVLTKKQLYNFCLSKSDGEILLKRNHNYFYQVQTQLGVLGLKWCDFVVWTDISSVVLRIQFDEDFWSDLSQKLISFHHQWLCPEFFEMRIPRKLLPLKSVIE